MAAFAGILDRRPGSNIADNARLMAQRMCHEARDVADNLFLERLAFALSWVHRPGSCPQAKPVWNESRNRCLWLSGEDFSESARGERPTDGLLREAGTAGYLLQRYEEVGVQCLSALNGWFSGLIADLGEKKLILFNDRYGLSRVYYYESDQCFLFSSEAKGLLAVLPDTRRIDETGLGEFFSVGCVLQNRSLFQGIQLLPPGSAWTFEFEGRVRKERYFDPESWEQQKPLTAQAYQEQLTEVFSRITPHYLQGPEQVAMSLTGGLDSRMILAALRPSPGTLPCYTFGGPYRDCADVRIARRLAKACGQSHTTIEVRPDFFGEFRSLAEKTVYLTDGTMDVSGAVELHVNRRAKEIAPVRLTGNYGSEILRSNVTFRPGKINTAILAPEFIPFIDKASQTYHAETTGNRLSFIAFKQVPWHHHARFAVERSQLTPRSPFLDNELVRLAYRAPTALATGPESALQMVTRRSPDLLSIPTDRGLGGKPAVRKIAHQWQEFTVKAEYAYDYGMPQWLARVDHSFSALHLERLFLGRHKFYHFRLWYRDQLASTVRDVLLDPKALSRPFIRRAAVESMVAEHLEGRGNHTLSLHKLLTLELTQRQLLEA